MKISTKGRYAVRLMLDIARHGENCSVSMKEVAERQDISFKYLEQIVNLLIKAGFVQSRRGSHGGYRLTRAPEEYTIADILRVTEGALAPVACLAGETNQCPRVDECPTLKVWEGLYDTVNTYLEGVTIADIMKQEDEAGGSVCCV